MLNIQLLICLLALKADVQFNDIPFQTDKMTFYSIKRSLKQICTSLTSLTSPIDTDRQEKQINYEKSVWRSAKWMKILHTFIAEKEKKINEKEE